VTRRRTGFIAVFSGFATGVVPLVRSAALFRLRDFWDNHSRFILDDYNMKNDLRAFDTEIPVGSAKTAEAWGSDAVAEILRAIDIPYIALNPGASYRGLHDSLVNYLGNSRPQMMVCLHEESAVAIAHGYAKASGRMMAAAIHSNVGLMHASMAVFNAWCDRVPMMVLGASGPMDADKRRPWIDWIHTCADQGGLTRNFTKWDNQPFSAAAAYEAVLRGAQIANTPPCGPVYINLDVAMQETKLGALPPLPEVARYGAPRPPIPAAEPIAAAAALLAGAKRPVMVMGRGARSMEAWKKRIALAEKLQAYVVGDLKAGAMFPTDHPLHVTSGARLSVEEARLLKEADVILSLDCIDLGGFLRLVYGREPVRAKVIHASCDVYSHRGWSMEYQMLAPVDVQFLCDADSAVAAFDASITATRPAAPEIARPALVRPGVQSLCIYDIAEALNKAAAGSDICLTRVPIGWNSRYRELRHPLDHVGSDGGAGLGSAPGMAIGAALALKGSGRTVVSVQGDGEFLMAPTAIWTAVRYGIPCLMIISNNRGYYNDEAHQENVARTRGRPVENKWIGQKLESPDLDLAAMARSQGAAGIGPVKEARQLAAAIEQGLDTVRQGKVCLVDVHVAPGYE
jgi:thiamine pyrophosphate-dependent acetolactate synthase large subunit-like protein